MARKCILVVGLDPTLLKFSPERGLNAEGVMAAGKCADERLNELGYEVQTCLLSPAAETESPVLTALERTTFDCIMVAAGLRGLMEYNLLFEKVMNAIHQKAPSAKLCFNTHPGNTAEANLRWT